MLQQEKRSAIAPLFWWGLELFNDSCVYIYICVCVWGVLAYRIFKNIFLIRSAQMLASRAGKK